MAMRASPSSSTPRVGEAASGRHCPITRTSLRRRPPSWAPAGWRAEGRTRALRSSALGALVSGAAWALNWPSSAPGASGLQSRAGRMPSAWSSPCHWLTVVAAPDVSRLKPPWPFSSPPPRRASRPETVQRWPSCWMCAFRLCSGRPCWSAGPMSVLSSATCARQPSPSGRACSWPLRAVAGALGQSAARFSAWVFRSAFTSGWVAQGMTRAVSASVVSGPVVPGAPSAFALRSSVACAPASVPRARASAFRLRPAPSGTVVRMSPCRSSASGIGASAPRLSCAR